MGDVPAGGHRLCVLKGVAVLAAGATLDSAARLPGARVQLSLAPPWPSRPGDLPGPPITRPLAEAVSGSDGAFTLAGVPRGVELQLEAAEPRAGLFCLRFTLPRTGPSEVDLGRIGLEQGDTLTVAVVDENERSVSGSHLWLTHRSILPPALRGLEVAGVPRAFSERGPGLFELTGVPSRRHLVRALAPGYALETHVVDGPPVRGAWIDWVMLARSVSVPGLVLDTGDHPVPGAVVVVEGSRGIAGRWARTGPDGSFRLEGVPLGATLTVTAGGYAPETCLAHDDGTGAPEPGSPTAVTLTPLRVVLRRLVPVRARVVTRESHAPVQAAQVFVNRSDGSGARAQTGPDGWATLELDPPDRYSLAVDAPDHPPPPPLEVALEVSSPPVEVVFEVARGHVLRGHVVEAGTGLPIPGAQVHLEQRGDAMVPSVTRKAVTDAAGEYVARGLALRPTVITAFSPAFLCGRQEILSSSGGRAPPLELVRGRVLVGRVLDPEGAPILGCLVERPEVFKRGNPWRGHPWNPDRAIECVTDADGTFRLVGLGMTMDGPQILEASHPAFLGTRVTVPPTTVEAEPGPVEISLSRGGYVAVTVLPNEPGDLQGLAVRLGEPMENQPGLASVAEVLVDPDGKALLGPFEPGGWWVQTLKEGHVPTRATETQVAEGETTRLTLQLEPQLSLEGRLVDPEGRPVAGARLSLLGKAEMLDLDVFSTARGTFKIAGVSPGRHKLQVYGLAEFEMEWIELTAGAAPEDHVLSPLATIRGRVTSTDGKGVGFASIKVREIAGGTVDSSWAPGKSAADLQGDFELRVAGGVLSLEVEAPSLARWQQLLEIRAGQEIVLRPRLPAAASLAGHLVDPSGQAPGAPAAVVLIPSPRNEWAWDDVQGTSSADGAFQLEDLPPGRYSLLAWCESPGLLGRLDTLDVPVPGGPDLVIELEPFEGLLGKTLSRRVPRPGVVVAFGGSGDGPGLETSSGDGGWYLQRLPVGRYEVHARLAGLTSTSVPTSVEAGCLTRLANLDLTSWRLHGVVTRNGLPVRGAVVEVTFYDGSGDTMSLQATDVNGAYAILLLGDGLADVLIKEGEGDGETTTRRTVRLARGQPEARLNLEQGEN